MPENHHSAIRQNPGNGAAAAPAGEPSNGREAAELGPAPDGEAIDPRTGPVVMGVDVGSTTVKVTVVDPVSLDILWCDYQRHQTKQPEMVFEFPRFSKTGGVGAVTPPHIAFRFFWNLVTRLGRRWRPRRRVSAGASPGRGANRRPGLN